MQHLEVALGRPYPDEGIEFEDMVRDTEMELISKAMKESEGNQSRAARLLRLNRDKLRYRLKNFDMGQGGTGDD